MVKGLPRLWIVFRIDNGYIVTAYTSIVAFNDVNGWVAAPSGSCWLNNLENDKGVLSTTKALNTVHPEQTHFDFGGYGPSYGGGFDFAMSLYTLECGTNMYSYAGLTSDQLMGPNPSKIVRKVTEIEAYQIDP